MSATKTNSKANSTLAAGNNPQVLLVSYPSAGTVAAYDINTVTLIGSVAVPGSVLYSYYDQ